MAALVCGGLHVELDAENMGLTSNLLTSNLLPYPCEHAPPYYIGQTASATPTLSPQCHVPRRGRKLRLEAPTSWGSGMGGGGGRRPASFHAVVWLRGVKRSRGEATVRDPITMGSNTGGRG